MKILLRHFNNGDYDFISQKLFPTMTHDEINTMIREGCETLKYEGSYFEMLGIEVDYLLVGYISLYEREKYSVNIGITIIPEFRRKGIAYKALTKALHHAKELGYNKAIARVLKDNEPSLKLCEKLRLCIVGNDVTSDGKEVYKFEKTLSAQIALADCNNDLWHEFYKNYVSDPMMDNNTYTYDFDSVQKNYHLKTTDETRLYFFIINKNKVIGQIYLKRMYKDKKTTEFGVALINDSVKGKGYGSNAIRILINYAFDILGLKRYLQIRFCGMNEASIF